MSAGYDHCVCIDSEGRVWSWGARGHTPRDVRPGSGDWPRGGAAEGGAGEGGAAPALIAARLVSGGQLARWVDARADALEPQPAAPAELVACRAAHVAAGGHFTLVWPAEAAPWGSAQAGHVEGARRTSPLLYAASSTRDAPGGD